MKQLVQLQEKVGDFFAKQKAIVLVIFREESEGQAGLEKVVENTKTTFTLALDQNAERTKQYSSGKQVHDSYIIDSDGIIRVILNGTRYDRAQAAEFENALMNLNSK